VAKFTITVSGQAPDVARAEGDTQLALALVHVVPNATYRNRVARGPGGHDVVLAPMALTLTYALVAFSGKDYVSEQQAMSIALAWIAANPIQRLTVAATPAHVIDCTMTLESATLDEVARLWQSLSGAMRLTAVVRIGIVFVGADPAPVVPSPVPTKLGLLVSPAEPPFAGGPRLLAISEPLTMTVGAVVNEAPLAPGEAAVVAGLGLDGPERLFLSPVDDSASFDVTAWVSNRRANTLRLTLPAAVGAPPAGAPAPGVYRLRLGAAPLTGASIPLVIGAP
jgi:Pvc16 N-terminal domain